MRKPLLDIHASNQLWLATTMHEYLPSENSFPWIHMALHVHPIHKNQILACALWPQQQRPPVLPGMLPLCIDQMRTAPSGGIPGRPSSCLAPCHRPLLPSR